MLVFGQNLPGTAILGCGGLRFHFCFGGTIFLVELPFRKVASIPVSVIRGSTGLAVSLASALNFVSFPMR